MEYYLIGENNWLIGSTKFDKSRMGVYRSLKNPEEPLWNPYYGAYVNGSQPAHFYSDKVYCGEKDNGGVHRNS